MILQIHRLLSPSVELRRNRVTINTITVGERCGLIQHLALARRHLLDCSGLGTGMAHHQEGRVLTCSLATYARSRSQRRRDLGLRVREVAQSARSRLALL